MTKEYSITMQRGLAMTDMRAGLAGSRSGRIDKTMIKNRLPRKKGSQ
jgi:hypothetical protein